ncbi:MAG: acyl-CoA dehydrogenase family protein [Myxococcaceae bacterium]|nr:acyl-CoA dehydrogenase family protein [Myxococcaceae bacterium]MCA3013864.1 acyl-CoA dehydrogenase family protein [Myxococcaceae bacterium]
MTTTRRPGWFEGEAAVQRLLERQLGPAFEKAKPRLQRMGERAANEGAAWAHTADHEGPRLVTHDRAGTRVDDIEYHPSYRALQALGYGGGIIAATYDPTLSQERGQAPRALTFGLGYLFAQAEAGLFCPICMTDGAARLLAKFGTPSLRERFVPRLASTNLERLYTGAMFLTEKAGGSDVGQVSTVAKGGAGVPGEAVTLHGDKWFCSNVDADVIMILARPEGAGPGTKGLGLYVLPRTLDDGRRNRFRIERLKDKLGERSFPTGEVTLDGAQAYLLGGPGQGFHQMAEMLNLSRLYNAIASVAVMRRSVTEALEWAEQRVAFGRRIIEHPLLTETLLDLASEQRVALAWAFRGVELLDRLDGGTASDVERRTLRVLTPLLKYVLGKWAVRLASEGLEVLAGNGYIEDWPMARVLRDAQVLPIWEGTTNILVLDAFRALRKEGAHEVLFAELERLAAEAPADVQGRLAALVEELKQALAELSDDARAEHAFRDFTDRAAVLWAVAVTCAKSTGAGTEADVRAGRRVLSRHVPAGLLRRDRATVDDVRAVAFR